MAARRRRCPSCLGTLRRGSGGLALYRAGRHVAIGVVCNRCLARSFRVVLGAVSAVDAVALEDEPARSVRRGRRGAFVRSVLETEK